MWSTKLPKIETLWNPKTEEQQPGDEVSLTPRATTNGDSSTDTKEKELNGTRLGNLLAALSFEEHPKYSQGKKKKPKKRKSRPLPINTSCSHLTLRGTRVDSDIYFDAEEYGDLEKDDFKLKGSPRESVVLADIKVAHQEEHDSAVETVLGHREDPPDNTSSGSSEEEFEYSEREFSEHCDDGEEQEEERRNGAAEKVSPPSNSRETSLEAESKATPQVGPPLSPLPPNELPLRFLRAGKNNPAEGLRRYEATLKMRKDEGVDGILREPCPDFDLIKKYYPHFCHRTGKNGEPCFYEQPPKTDLRALREGGVTLEKLLRHYTMVTEFQWQYLERDDLATSIYIVDLDGIRMTDFAGEAVDFVKRASAFSAQHYPERAGYVFVINVPVWFKLIWTVVKPIIDEDTLKKIYILRGKDEIRTAMQERIALENIPPEYGGTSMPLGESPEEHTLAELIAHNNTLAEQGLTVCKHDCKFCTWVPARSY